MHAWFPTDASPDFAKAWMFAPPAVAAALLGILLFSTNNNDLFLLLNHAGGGRLDGVWAHVTMLGDTLLTLVLLYALGYRNPSMIWSGLLAGVLSSLLVHGVKDALLIPRPAAVLASDLIHVVGPVLKKYSFPSGHTTSIFVLAAVVCFHTRFAALRAIAITIAVVVGLSRVGVGAHWPADVAGGAIVGWVSGIFGVKLAHRWPFGIQRGAQIAWGAILLGCIAAILLRPDPIIESTRVFQYLFAVGIGAIGLWGVWNRLRQALGC